MKRKPARHQVGNVTYDIVRADGRLERNCEHGIGHTVGHRRGYLLATDVHGCDGCCKTYAIQEVRK